MMDRLKRLVPPAHELRSHRWLQWLGPLLHRPWLWRASRHGIALGVALGLFFGLLFPVAQIPFSAAAAVVLRANLPAAVASTLVTNPATFGPIYYVAWKLGSTVLGEPAPERAAQQERAVEAVAEAAATAPTAHKEGWFTTVLRRLSAVGKPLVLGLAIMAVAVGLLSYFLVSWVWTARVLVKRRRRRGAHGR